MVWVKCAKPGCVEPQGFHEEEGGGKPGFPGVQVEVKLPFFPSPEVRVGEGKDDREGKAGGIKEGSALLLDGEIAAENKFFQHCGGNHGGEEPCRERGLRGFLAGRLFEDGF